MTRSSLNFEHDVYFYLQHRQHIKRPILSASLSSQHQANINKFVLSHHFIFNFSLSYWVGLGGLPGMVQGRQDAGVGPVVRRGVQLQVRGFYRLLQRQGQAGAPCRQHAQRRQSHLLPSRQTGKRHIGLRKTERPHTKLRWCFQALKGKEQYSLKSFCNNHNVLFYL